MTSRVVSEVMTVNSKQVLWRAPDQPLVPINEAGNYNYLLVPCLRKLSSMADDERIDQHILGNSRPDSINCKTNSLIPSTSVNIPSGSLLTFSSSSSNDNNRMTTSIRACEVNFEIGEVE